MRALVNLSLVTASVTISFNICGGRTWSAFATSWGTAGAGAAGFVTGGELIIN
jgi:hypothetical protein